MFPFITCEFTGSCRPGYAVCHHVVHGAPIAEVYQATDEEMGYVCCMLCQRREDQSEDELTARDFELVCADCYELNVLNGQKIGQA
jgi:hypothetical protein